MRPMVDLAAHCAARDRWILVDGQKDGKTCGGRRPALVVNFGRNERKVALSICNGCGWNGWVGPGERSLACIYIWRTEMAWLVEIELSMAIKENHSRSGSAG